MRGDMGEVSQGLADVSLTPGREPRVRGTRADAFAGESQALDEIAKQVGGQGMEWSNSCLSDN